MTRSTVAAAVRKEKEAHPERFCATKGCLWRTLVKGGTFPYYFNFVDCRKHPATITTEAK